MNPIAKCTVVLALFISSVSSVALGANDSRKSGTWSRQEYKISGSWSIVEEGGRLHLQLSDDFKTKRAPDLKIFLSRAELDSLTGKNATADAVLIAPLRSVNGGQSYPIPRNVNLSEFRSIILHCEQYSKLWGGAPL